MRDYLADIIGIIVPVLLCAALFFGMFAGLDAWETKHEEKLWNNGRCDVCGGTWEYEQAVGHRSYTTYIYICEDCGKRIEIDEIRE